MHARREGKESRKKLKYVASLSLSLSFRKRIKEGCGFSPVNFFHLRLKEEEEEHRELCLESETPEIKLRERAKICLFFSVTMGGAVREFKIRWRREGFTTWILLLFYAPFCTKIETSLDPVRFLTRDSTQTVKHVDNNG